MNEWSNRFHPLISYRTVYNIMHQNNFDHLVKSNSWYCNYINVVINIQSTMSSLLQRDNGYFGWNNATVKIKYWVD
jgi:hypothetical protein